jgi:hypothetical protein
MGGVSGKQIHSEERIANDRHHEHGERNELQPVPRGGFATARAYRLPGKEIQSATFAEHACPPKIEELRFLQESVLPSKRKKLLS